MAALFSFANLEAHMELIAVALFLSLSANRIIEAFVAPLKKRYPDLDLWWLIYVTWVAGGVLSYAAGVNLFAAVVPTLNPTAGLVLTALVVGGGANLIADLFPNTPTLELTTSIEKTGPAE